MQVGEEAQLHAPRCELLYLDPQECAKVAHKAWGEPGEASVELRGQLTSAQHPDVKGQKAPKSPGEECLWERTIRRRGRGQYQPG